MQFTLLMVAAAIAMVGAIFHGYVGGRLYMKNIRIIWFLKLIDF